MPITKERLHDLFNAANSIELTFTANAQSTLAEAERALRGQVDPLQALHNIQQIHQAYEHQIMHESRAILKEQILWRATHRRNDRAKIYRERERRERGIQPRNPQQRQPQINFDAPSISTQQFLREMEALGMTTEEALREFERKHTEEDEAPAQGQVQAPQASSQTPGDPSRFIEDSDDFAPPTGEC